MPETFMISHPDKPEAGAVRCDDAAWDSWRAEGWVKVEEMPADEPAKKKGKA